MRPRFFRSEADRYTLFGALFGFLFPLIATLMGAYETYGIVSLESIRGVQMGDHLLWIINTAPFWLGLFARLAGMREDRLHETVAMRDAAIAESTQSLRAALEEAKAATRARSAFLANMSHEIRTPMNGVIGMTSLLQETPLTAQQRDFVETIRTSGDTLLTVINDILDFSKIDSGTLRLERYPFNLRTALEDTLDLVAFKAAEKNLDLSYFIHDGTPEQLLGDVTRLRQIIANLLTNAVKFTVGGEVVLEVEGDTPADDAGTEDVILHFSVRDTGIGIPSERIDHLFQPFTQVDESTTRRFGGTGLGLAICKHLVELMGGEIWVESMENEGSTFHFTIIAQRCPEAPMVSLQSDHQHLDGLRVMIVDDNATSLRLLRHYTEAWGMQPFAAGSGAEALDLLRLESPFDVAILDVRMPDMDGLGLASTVRAELGYDAPPLVLLSSMTDAALKRQAEEIGVQAVLYKPLKPALLLEALDRLLGDDPTDAKTASQSLAIPQMSPELPLRILLAEDNVVNQKVALSLLERLGYRADLATNGQEVLDAVHRQRYDLVLMDVMMPEMDGLEATRRLCETIPKRLRPRIVAMTASALDSDRLRCLEAGMDDFISKPVEFEALISALQRCESKTHLEMAALMQEIGIPVEEDVYDDAAHLATVDEDTLAYLRDSLCNGEGTIADDLIASYIEDAGSLVTQLETAWREGDVGALRRHAHTLKASSRMFGAMRLGKHCELLEMAETPVSGQLESIRSELTRVQQRLADASSDPPARIQRMHKPKDAAR